MITVETFYNEHPINETEILEKVEATGKSLDELKAEDLYPFDQDHYGALEATDVLVDELGIGAESRVLDLCCGLGGTSRYLAQRYGARVHGIDRNRVRIGGAQRLTERVGLSDRVTYEVGEATRTEGLGADYDAILSQESLLHIDDKEALLHSCLRALRPGGGLGFTDVIATELLTAEARQHFAEVFSASHIASLSEYEHLLRGAGFRDVRSEDLSPAWRSILHDRLEMYRSLERESVARYGQERFDTYVRNYEFFIEQIDLGAVGGGRLIGKRP